MASTNIINGTNLVVKIGNLQIGVAKTCSMSISHEPRDATSKDSAGNEDSLEGLVSAEVSGDGLYNPAHAVQADNVIYPGITNRTRISWSFGSKTAGDVIYYGEGYFTKLDLSGGVEESATFSFSIKVAGGVSSTPMT